MKEFMRILVEETAIGLGQGDPMTWFWVAFFTLTSMKLANSLGKLMFRQVCRAHLYGGLYHIYQSDYTNRKEVIVMAMLKEYFIALGS